ncbi:MAG: hypothetical protein LC122_13120 [Chitinophagales bacterium]|nr:hypothetical protein [Chitinophagales bacterium]
MTKVRGEYLSVTDTVNLTIQLTDELGQPINADSFPTISLISPTGLVILQPTSQGVTQLDVGKYEYSFTIPINGPYGVFTDLWVAYVNGQRIEQTLNFIVAHTQFAAMNIDGYEKLGDDTGFNYSQDAIKNINKLIKMLRARLNSAGKAKAKNDKGEVIYIDCDIFSVDMLVTFLATALSDFNQTPYFTFFQFDDAAFVAQFGEILVEGATLYALSSMALLERGREYQLTDNSLSFNPPTVSELLNTQYNTLLTHYWEKLKYIKNSLRPAPIAAGVFSMSNYASPAIRRLRLLKERSFF